MATITGLTAAQMLLLADDNINGGIVNNLGNLVLTTRGGKSIDAGPIMSSGTSGQYYRGDKTWQNLNKAAVGLDQVENVAGSTVYLPRWQPNTTYSLGQQVVLPNNDIGTPKVAFVSGTTYDATKWNVGLSKYGQGLVAVTEMTGASASTTSSVMVVQNIPSFTFKANRWYEVEWTTGVVCTAAPSLAPLAQIYSASTSDAATATTGLTELMGYNCCFTATNQAVRANPKRKLKYAVDTTLQIKATLSGNSATIYAGAGPTYPAQLSIHDLGTMT